MNEDGIGSKFIERYSESDEEGLQLACQIIASYEMALQRLLFESKISTCTWKHCDPWSDFDHWETDCGQAICLENGGPVCNEYKYCCFCGKPIVEDWSEDRE